MSSPPTVHGSNWPLLATLALLLAGYATATWYRLPQAATATIVAANAAQHEREAAADAGEPGQTAVAARHPPLCMVLPFAALLGAIAIAPLLPFTVHWWENNLHRFGLAAGLAAVTLGYYVFAADFPIEGHWPTRHAAIPSPAGLNFALAGDVLASAMLSQFVPFIVLLFTLYTISGGVRIEGDLPAHPSTNALFLAVGAVLASLIGTTGAAMLLIRPLLETNSERKHVAHTVIFFIFIVCNCGGCLLPLGDPPLLLGYLQGVPFLWTLVLWKEWLFVNSMLIAIYYLADRFWCYPREQATDITQDENRVRPLRFSGLWLSALLLGGVVLSVAFLDPSTPVPGTNWYPWLYLREAAQLALVMLSLWLGDREIRRANNFNYAPMWEVAALFFGIFVCMQPALQILAVEGPNLGLSKAWHFFWATGGLSSLLDNAPTYVVFAETARSLTAKFHLAPAVAGVAEDVLAAVSLGAVFMGANTYIGNGPNFMVKAIAEKSGVRMPGFFGYLLYSGCILLPLWVLTTLLFLR